MEDVKVNYRIMLWILIGVLFLAAVFMTFQAGVVEASTGVVQAGSVTKSAASSYGGMVGGC